MTMTLLIADRGYTLLAPGDIKPRIPKVIVYIQCGFKALRS